ncbi:unnamed protein product [Rotaria sordida]|uniref:Nose resistant-to-fluoxetine protein N-terminal domain-containing protein n=3 Tax=Rotaria sordida TaxID=392033 RepID=A0A814TSR8_9BILA|nr:unnamed protein product [Rotaria sordida]
MLTIALFLLFSVLLNTNSQFIPLRFDLAINRLRQYQHFSLINLIKDVEYNLTPEQMLEYMSLSLSNNKTSSCEQDFELILRAAKEKDTWAIRVLDAWGKPLPSGILKGNVYWVGNYDECIQPMYNPVNKSFISQPFNTQHCTLAPTASRSNSNSLASLVFGLCVPSSCDRQSLISLIHILLKKTNITQDNLICSNDLPNGQKDLTSGAIATIVILSLLGLLVLIGTIIDLILMSELNSVHNLTIHHNVYNHLVDDDEITTQSESRRTSGYFSLNPTSRIVFLAEFSVLKSLHRIFTLEEKTSDDKNESFLFINGIRVLSLFWIIIAHSLLFGLSYTSNIIDILISTRNIAFQLISSAQFSVDTFFVLSGFLTAILFVRQVKKEEKLSFRLMFLYYIHRYIRLTPAFLLMILVSINLTPYFGRGPIYPIEQGFESKGCRTRSWWTSIFYIGNIVRPDDMCLNIAWYLHNDMQFHWIAPLTLIPFALGRKILSFLIAMLFVFVGIGSTLAILLYYPNMSFNDPTALTNNGDPSFFKSVYIKPWCRISAYAVGLLTGYIVIITGRQYRINRYSKIIGTILIIVIGLACLFTTYPNSIHVPGLSRSEIVAYASLSRTFWSIVIGWLLFLCSTNQGGIVNKILSWPVWTPLARLNYSCYLVHSMILHIIIFNQTMPFYYQGHLVINNFISHIFFSYVAAILVSIFFETPFFIIEKKLFKR